MHYLRRRPILAFFLGLCAVFLWNCGPGRLPMGTAIDSPETAQAVLVNSVLPKIDVRDDVVSDEMATRYTTDQMAEPIPRSEDFPLHAAQPSGGNTVYVEIFSSSEKANVNRQNERWLVEVADTFNQRQETLPSGEVIQVGVRQVPSGTAARMLGA